MFSEVRKLEDMQLELERVNSLFNCICESYFSKYKPEPMDLMLCYPDCTNIIYTIKDLVKEQSVILRESIGLCYQIRVEVKKELTEIMQELTQKELKKRVEQVLILLSIADLKEKNMKSSGGIKL